MMRVFGRNFEEFIAGGLVVLAVIFLVSCKQSVAEKNTAIIKGEMPAMLAQKDSLQTEIRNAQQTFEALKTKIDQTPPAVINTPENAKLSETIKALVLKSGKLGGVIPAVEAKLQELENTMRDAPTETVQKEIDAMKESLQLQRGRIVNYTQNYQKIEHQLDSIQSLQK